jgi:hypothetical protein
MKKLIIVLITCIFYSLEVKSQTPRLTLPASSARDTLDQGLGKMSGLSTGVLQDILSNYIQVAAKNLTSTNSSLQLKLNWFALNGKDSVDKYKAQYFKDSWWQRNGEFVFSGGVDKSNQLNSWQAGLNYNVLNRRDTDMHHYTIAYADAYIEETTIINATRDHFKVQVNAGLEQRLSSLMSGFFKDAKKLPDMQDRLDKGIPGMFHGGTDDQKIATLLETQLEADLLINPSGSAVLSTKMTETIKSVAEYEGDDGLNIAINNYVNSQTKSLVFPSYVTAAQAMAIGAYLDEQVKTNAILHGKLGANSLADANKIVFRNYHQLVQYVSQQSLLTISYLYTNGTGSVLNSHVGGLTYLKGLGNFRSLKTGQLKASLTDTLTGTDPTGKVRNFGRNVIALQAGYNQVLATQQKKSILELNLAGEADWATSGYIVNTDQKRLYLDAYLRARLPSTPWLKLDLKYDPKGGNVLGLLDFTYNLDKQ